MTVKHLKIREKMIWEQLGWKGGASNRARRRKMAGDGWEKDGGTDWCQNKKKKRGRRTAVVRYGGATSLHLTPQEGLAEGRCSGREWTRLFLRQGTANNRKVGHLSCVFISMITADTLTSWRSMKAGPSYLLLLTSVFLFTGFLKLTEWCTPLSSEGEEFGAMNYVLFELTICSFCKSGKPVDVLWLLAVVVVVR